MSMIQLAEKFRKHIVDRREANRTQMEKGKPHDEYMQLVGRNKELTDMLNTVNETASTLLAMEDDDQ